MTESLDNEIARTAARLQAIEEASKMIDKGNKIVGDATAQLKESSEQLRRDVDALAMRIAKVETSNKTVAEELVVNDKRIVQEQEIQDDRLTTLEPDEE